MVVKFYFHLYFMRHTTIIILTIITLFLSCSESKKLKNETIKPYPKELDMSFHYKLFHHSADVSTLYIQSYAREYRVTIRVYENFRSKALVYEHTQQIVADANSVQSVPVPIRLKQYALEILLFSTNDNNTFSDAVLVDKTFINDQTLLPLEENNIPILKNYHAVGKKVKFKMAEEKEYIFLRYFDDNYKPAPPPHISQTLLFNPLKGTDKIFTIAKGDLFTLEKKGLYFVQTDTLSKNGIFLNAVDAYFPKITDADDLTLSIRYITKNDEYKRLTARKADTKLELDRFWLARAGDKEKARELIRLYYNRVQLTNEYFTSYKAGWKTDRGIIFTIFGKPTRVQKTEKYEYWYYKRTSKRDFLEFVFDKRQGIYVLRRSPTFAHPWGAEVFAWRSGNVW